MMQIATATAVFAFPALMVVAALCDVASLTIPNRISLALIVLFLAVAALRPLDLTQTALHLGVGLAALVLVFGAFAMGWMGGGDAKLIAAASLWIGPAAAAPFVVFTALAGGVLALTLLLARQFGAPWLVRSPGWAQRLLEPKGAVPYGVAIAAGAIAAFPGSGLV